MLATVDLPDIVAQIMSRSDDSASGSVADSELMLRYVRGDADAFARLYRRYRDRLYRFVVRFAGSPVETDEICQDVWMAIVHSRERYRPDASFATYLFSIAHRQGVERYRKRGLHEEEFIPENYADDDVPDQALFDVQSSDALTRSIASLPPLQREAFLMRMEGHLDITQIALATGTTKETSKSRLRYAYQRLRVALKDCR